MKHNLIDVVVLILVILSTVLITYGIVALAFYGICRAFGLTFSFKYAVGVWLILYLVSSVFKKGGKE